MPRKSAAELEMRVATVTDIPQRPPIPRAFRRGSAEAAGWTEIVNAQAADWFQSGDLPLLEAYCRAIVQYRRVSADIENGNGGLGAPFTLEGSHGGMQPNPIYSLQDRLARQMATLAVKLRLSQSTRLTAQVAGTKGRAQAGRNGAQGPAGEPEKPWQRSAN